MHSVWFVAPAFAADTANSMPSDHAALAFALVAAFLILSWRLGLAFAAYAVTFICLPRLYVGLHWPSDLVVGAAIGLVVGVAFRSPAPRAAFGRVITRFHNRAPGAFYAGLFLLSLGLVTRFDDVRAFGHWVAGEKTPVAARLDGQSPDCQPIAPARAPALAAGLSDAERH